VDIHEHGRSILLCMHLTHFNGGTRTSMARGDVDGEYLFTTFPLLSEPRNFSKFQEISARGMAKMKRFRKSLLS